MQLVTKSDPTNPQQWAGHTFVTECVVCYYVIMSVMLWNAIIIVGISVTSLQLQATYMLTLMTTLLYTMHKPRNNYDCRPCTVL